LPAAFVVEAVVEGAVEAAVDVEVWPAPYALPSTR
jgi:hypothetical protein